MTDQHIEPVAWRSISAQFSAVMCDLLENGPPLLPIEAAATFYCVSPSTIRRWIAAGELPFVRVPNEDSRTLRIPNVPALAQIRVQRREPKTARPPKPSTPPPSASRHPGRRVTPLQPKDRPVPLAPPPLPSLMFEPPASKPGPQKPKS